MVVRDGHGHAVPASATAQGTNRAPYVQLTSFYGFSDTSVFSCYCLAGVELDIYRTASSGTCTVTIGAKNHQGRVGTSIFTIPYRQGTGAPGW